MRAGHTGQSDLALRICSDPAGFPPCVESRRWSYGAKSGTAAVRLSRAAIVNGANVGICRTYAFGQERSLANFPQSSHSKRVGHIEDAAGVRHIAVVILTGKMPSD